MMKVDEVKYYLNGNEVKESEVLSREGAEKTREETIMHKYYIAPLTEDEQKQKDEERKNAYAFFERLREQREDLEKRHG